MTESREGPWLHIGFADGRAAEQKHKGTPEAESGVPFFTQKRRENAFFYFGKYFTKNGGCFIISLKKLYEMFKTERKKQLFDGKMPCFTTAH